MRSSRGQKVSRSIRTYRKALLHIVAVLAVIAVLFVLLSVLFTPKGNSEEDGMLDASAHSVLGEPAGTIDVLFLGDSEVYNALSPMRMWEEYGFTSSLMSTNVQNLPYAFTLLRRATNAQKPRVVVIETNEIYKELSLNDIAKRMVQDALPVFEYHDRWKSLTLRDFDPRVEYTWTDPFKGYVVNADATPADATGWMAPTDEREEISRLNRWALGQVIDYCRSIDAVPVLVSVPSTKNWNMARHNAIADYADEQGIAYIDLNAEPTFVDIDWQTETRDKGDHLNLYGATKASDVLGGLLSQEYALPDHRGDAAYASWDDSLELYHEEVEKVTSK